MIAWFEVPCLINYWNFGLVGGAPNGAPPYYYLIPILVLTYYYRRAYVRGTYWVPTRAVVHTGAGSTYTKSGCKNRSNIGLRHRAYILISHQIHYRHFGKKSRGTNPTRTKNLIRRQNIYKYIFLRRKIWMRRRRFVHLPR